MKKNINYFTLFIIFFFLYQNHLFGQLINWANSKYNRHLINLQVGAEYGVVYGAGYGYKINEKFFPIWVLVDVSAPMGGNKLDDFKSRLGVQMNWIKFGDFQISSDIKGIYRKFENKNVAILNFGVEMNGQLGYYKTQWFTSIVFGFDKAIASHYQHSKLYMHTYPEVKNGWIEPAMGGNFYYGIQGGCSIKPFDITLKAGKIINQDFKTNPLLPIFGNLGLNYNF